MKTFAAVVAIAASSALRKVQEAPKGNYWADKICWKQSSNRGVGVPPSECADGRVKHQGLCYAACPAEYPHQEGMRCYKSCAQRDDEYTVNTVASCRKPNTGLLRTNESVGRGTGHPPQMCADGREKQAGLCYTTCPANFVGNGPVCWKQCHGEFSHNGGAMCCKSARDCTDFIYAQGHRWIDTIAGATDPANAMNTAKSAVENLLEFSLPQCE